MTTVSHGKPYAGNPHVRFEEGDPASAEPRRKSLLHKGKMGKESEDLRGMRESIEEMEQELKGMDKDIEDAKQIPDPEMREVAVRNIEQMRKSTREMVESFRKTYKMMLDAYAKEVPNPRQLEPRSIEGC